MIVISDTSPLLNLAIIGHLELLRALYGEIVIPQSVYHELVLSGTGMPGSEDIQTATWIVVKPVKNRSLVTSLRLQLDEGEAEAIALATELSADLLLLDERKARVVAAQFGLKFTGLLGFLVEAKHKQRLVAIKPVLDALLHQASFWVSTALYKHILEEVGEG